MALASGTRSRLVYVVETTRGTTPTTPSMLTLRSTSRNINLVKDVLVSNEIRSDRQIADARHSMNRVEGEVGFELSTDSYNDMLTLLTGGTWTAFPLGGTPNIQAVAASQKFIRAAGSWITDGLRVGDFVVSTGFTNAANNGVFSVAAVTATDLTVAFGATSLVDEASAAGRDVHLRGKRIDIGTTLKTMTVEKQFLDIAQYQKFAGVAVNTMRLNVAPNQMVGGTFGLIGMSGAAMSGTPLDASPDAAPTTSPMAAFDGFLVEGANQIAICTAVELMVDNKRRLEGVIGSKFSPDVFDATVDITGQATYFLEDATFVNKFFNETTPRMIIRLNDPDGVNAISITIPKITYTGSTLNPPQEGPVFVTMPFRAVVDSVSGTSLSFQRSTST